MKIINQTKNTVLAENTVVADRLLSRIVGLLKRKDFKPGDALIIKPCNSIHTFFMRFSIDALFVDNHNRVIASAPSLTPFHISPIYFNAAYVIELPVGSIASSATQKGDTLTII